MVTVNEVRAIKFKIVLILTVLCITLPLSSFGITPEGLESYALSGPKAKGKNRLYVLGGYVNPSWTTDYETIQTYASLGTSGGDYFTYGVALTAGNQFADRDAYFIRYDLTFGQQSVYFKFAHVDYRYIAAGKNVFSLGYNADIKLGQKASLYLLLGAYYRFNLNRWNTPSWSPTNFNTEDREGFVEMCFGTRIGTGQTYLTMDLNNRDPFISHNGDNIAVDISLNTALSQATTLRIVSSTRFTGLLAGTADFGEQTVLLGFITGF